MQYTSYTSFKYIHTRNYFRSFKYRYMALTVNNYECKIKPKTGEECLQAIFILILFTISKAIEEY